MKEPEQTGRRSRRWSCSTGGQGRRQQCSRLIVMQRTLVMLEAFAGSAINIDVLASMVQVALESVHPELLNDQP